jgi:hypothetical protein
MGSSHAEIQSGARGLQMYPTPNVLIVDFEGFYVDKEFTIKELAFYHPFTSCYWSGTFLPPFQMAYCKKKISHHIQRQSEGHGLMWEEGLYPQHMIAHILHYYATTHYLYAPDAAKSRILQMHTVHNIGNLESMNFPPWNILPFGSYCFFHDSTHCSCALDRCVRLGKHFFHLHSMKPL